MAETTTNSSTDENTIQETEVVIKKDRKRIFFSKIKRRLLRHLWFVRLCLFLGISLSFIALILLAGYFVGRTLFAEYMNLASDFIFTPAEKVRSIGGRTNVLILGKGGAGHDAPDLTDTIVFTSVDHNNFSLSYISLPRDIWIAELRAKLNSIYYWGNQKEEGGGIILAKSTVEQILGEPVQYAVVVDFEGFKQIIDVLGGVEVEVENTFTDERYPVPGKENDECDGDPQYSCRYETIFFEKGKMFMDGETALKFARSRNAEGDEGTDFARAARQEKIISAVKNKLMSREIFLSPKKLIELKKVAERYIETDIDQSAFAILARRIIDSRERVSSRVLPEELLLNPPKSPRYDNLYVFVPQSGDWEEIKKWTGCFLYERECD